MKPHAEHDRERLRADVMRWAAKIRVKPKQVRIQEMTRKWASCSTRGILTFSTDLLSQTREFREVVIVHEILHLTVQNHGKLFKSLLNAYVPGWEKRIAGKAAQLCGSDSQE